MNAISLFRKGDLDNKAGIEGSLIFYQCCPNHTTNIRINLKGFKPNTTHAIHIHEFGDFRQGCKSAGGHYNPYNQTHGNYKIQGLRRHVGDLINNITSNDKGEVHQVFDDDLVSLFGDTSVLGRSVMIHEGVDDLGLGNNKETFITGNAGGRMACSIIGVMNTKDY
jgi:Cu-Zn family superoxide dismutase